MMLARLVVAVIRLYQLLISPFLGNVCRFYPSCSRYAIACIETQGVARGGWLTVRRLLKCHPFHPGGFDFPPPATGNSKSFFTCAAVAERHVCNADSRESDRRDRPRPSIAQ